MCRLTNERGAIRFLLEERALIHVADSFELKGTEQNYLAQKLNEVSRSFALVVPFLEEPLREFLGTSYLLCRVLDNIEDSGRDTTWKNERIAEFSRLLWEPQLAAKILTTWEQETWPALTKGEKQMMGIAEGLALWQIYGRIPTAVRDIIRLWAGIMAEGMKFLGDPDKPPCLVRYLDVEILETEKDYNQYCYFVAGTVGHLVTELVIQHYQFTNDTAQFLRTRAEACGRGLQKTNIVKDFVEDLERGICYLPYSWMRDAAGAPLTLQGASKAWKANVLQDVLNELRDATAYLTALPETAAGYRRAALLCLLPAYQTLLSAALQQESLFTPAHNIKIPRETMAQCLADSQGMLYDDEAIRQYARRIEANIHAQFQVSDEQVRLPAR
jgi:farnesyl-diphosphate farnesyltransferase